MPAIFEQTFTVTPEQIDGQEHVNNLVYMHWIVDSATAHSRAQGWPDSRYIEEGVGWVVRSHQIEYLKAAFEGDRLLLRTWISELKRVTSKRRYEIYRINDDGEQEKLIQAETNWAFVDRQTGKPTRVHPDFVNSFEVVEEG